MPGRWDRSSKRLIGENPSHFIQWLLPHAQYQGHPEPMPTSMEPPEFEADNLFQIMLAAVQCLIHFEFQSTYDEDMAKRMWKYNALATITYDRPTYSVVIFLRPCKVPEPFYVIDFPTDERMHHFRFKVIKLWEYSVEEIKRTGLIGLFPLMVLAKDGKRLKVVEEIIQGIEADKSESSAELLSLTYILASMVFKKDVDRTWLKRRFAMLHDVFQDAWAYQEILQEGLQKGIEQGVQEGLQQGIEKGIEKERQQRLKDQRQLLLMVVQKQFPGLVAMAQRKADAIKEPDVLQTLVLNIFAAQTEEQARKLLQSSKTRKKKV